MKPEISVVIPVYNEAAGLAKLFARLYPALDALACPYEILFVNDGSSDNSAQILADQYRSRPEVSRVIFLNGNYGQHMAILAGFAAVRGEIIVTLDADLQNPPEEIGKLLDKIREGHDYVGSIRHHRHDAPWRSLASRIVNRLSGKITGIKISDQGNMLRAYSRAVVEQINLCEEGNTFVPALAYIFARNPVEVMVEHEDRSAGASKYSLYSLLRLNFDLMTNFSLIPLQVFSLLGMVLSLASAVLVLLLLGRRFFLGAEAQGVFTLFAIVFFLMGVILFGIGVVGEYVGRIYLQVRRRPRYVVQTTLENSPPELAEPPTDKGA